MGLFGKSNSSALPPQPLEDESSEAISYQGVVDYLTGLSRQDYDKIIKVVNVYRSADKDVKKILGVKDEPTTTLQPEPATDLLEDDDLATAFLDDDDLGLIPTEPKPKKDRKIEVKD